MCASSCVTFILPDDWTWNLYVVDSMKLTGCGKHLFLFFSFLFLVFLRKFYPL
jgi:hypothetical protein